MVRLFLDSGRFSQFLFVLDRIYSRVHNRVAFQLFLVFSSF